MDIIEEARKVFDIEMDALLKTRDTLGEVFEKILYEVTHCKGKVIVTGMGKPGHIAAKIAATFSSLGTPSFFLHPAEAMHGDLGMVSENDIVFVMSYSGESDEIVKILPNIKMIGAKIIALTGNNKSTLAVNADIVQMFPEFEEACCLGLAPTSSTTAELVYGDALAVVASTIYGFKEADFGRFHPAGSLGKRILLKVDDLMVAGNRNAVVLQGVSLKEAIIELGKKAVGIVSVIDDNKNIIGVITNGDIRRQLEKHADVYELFVEDVMTVNPLTIQSGRLAVDAARMFKKWNCGYMPVLDGRKVLGTIRLQDIIGAGIMDSVREEVKSSE